MSTSGRLLHAPAALPSTAWLRDQLVWADTFGAIWPPGEPTPLTPGQQESLAAIQFIQNQVPEMELFKPVEFEEADLRAATSRVSRASTRDASLTQHQLPTTTAGSVVDSLVRPSESDADSNWMSEADAIEYLHHGKFPPQTVDRLVKSGALVANGLAGYWSGDPGVVADLVTHGAARVAARGGWSLAADSASTAAGLARPASQRTRHVAMVRQLPALPAVRDDISISQLLDIRTDAKFERLRREYLDHLHRVEAASSAVITDLAHVEDPADLTHLITAEFQARMDAELRKANTALAKRLATAGIITGAVTCVISVVSAIQATTGPLRNALVALASAGPDLADLATQCVYTYREVDPFLRTYRSVLTSPT